MLTVAPRGNILRTVCSKDPRHYKINKAGIKYANQNNLYTRQNGHKHQEQLFCNTKRSQIKLPRQTNNKTFNQQLNWKNQQIDLR